MDFFVEFFLNVWLELAMKFLPGSKESAKATKICKFVTVGVILYVIVAFTAGMIMLTDDVGSLVLAVVLLLSSVLIFGIQVVLGIVFFGKRRSRYGKRNR